MLKNENIICVSTMDWDFLWTRKQRFMNMLAKEGNRVLYVEPFSWAEGTSWHSKFASIFKNIFLQPFGKLRKISETLYVLKPPITIPFKRHFYLAAFLNSIILKRQIKKVTVKLNFTCPLLWVYSPFDKFLVGGFNEKIVIYDCVDDHSAYPGVKKDIIEKVEKMLVKKADLVFVTARGLYEEKRYLNENIFIIPNGVDVMHFAKAIDEKTDVPADLQAIPLPRIGFMGGIADWIDLDLILYIARAKPEWSLVLIGPIITRNNLNLLRRTKNIYFLGRKDLQALPNYLKGLNVCLNPFKLGELAKMVNPLKVYEYLAGGKPVVSVDMPEIKQFKEAIKFASDKEDFVTLISEALKEDYLELRKKRIELVKNYSWEMLLETLVNHIEKYVAAK